MMPKKDQGRAIRFSTSQKRLIDEEAEKDMRTWQDEVRVLVAEALHARKFNIKNYI